MRRRLQSRIKRIYRYSVRARHPALSAVMLALLSKKLNGPGEKRILFIGSRASLDDLLAMARYSARYQYICLERFNFGDILKMYLPWQEVRENNYYLEPRFREGRREAREYISALFPHLRRLLKFDAVMSTNLGYLEQQELARVARDRAVPFIILLREGMVDPANTRRYFSVYENKRAVCDLFICYNEIIKCAILAQGVPGLTDENMKVSGIPRCDYYVREQAAVSKNQLVVFTFNSDVKFKNLLTDAGDFARASALTLEFYRLLLAFAVQRRDIRFVFKTKPSGYYIDEMRDVAANYYGDAGLPDNVIITGEGSAKDLVMESRWVIAVGNSTTVLESLLANRATGAPDYSEVIAPEKWDFLEGDDDLLTYIRTEEDLQRLIDRGSEDPGMCKTSKCRKALEQFLYSTDGRASERAERIMAEFFEDAAARMHGA